MTLQRKSTNLRDRIAAALPRFATLRGKGLPIQPVILASLAVVLSSAFAYFDIIAFLQTHRLRNDGWWVDALAGIFLTGLIGALWAGLLQRRGTAAESRGNMAAGQQPTEINEDRFRSLAEGSIEGIYVQRDFNILFANEALADIFGYNSAKELAVRNVLNLFHEQDRPRLKEFYRSRMAGKSEPAKFEIRGIHKKGNIIWLELLVRVVEWYGGPAVQVTLVDITDRKHAEEQLRSSQALLQAVFDALPTWVWVKDMSHRMLLVNSSMAKDIGHPPEYFHNLPPDKFFWLKKGELIRVNAADTKVMETGEPIVIPNVITVNADGQERIGHTIRVPLYDAKHCMIGVVGVAEDVTGLMRTEQELQESQALFQTVFDVIPHLVAIKDDQGRYLKVNRAWSDFFRVTPEEALNKRSSEIAGKPVDEVDIGSEEDRRVLNSRDGTQMFESPRTDHSGEARMLQHIKTRMEDSEGRATGLVSLGLDVTESRQGEQELRESQRMLQTVFDVIPHVMAIKDAQGRYLTVNRAWQKFFGLTQEETHGKQAKEFTSRPVQETNLVAEEDAVVSSGPEQAHVFESERINSEGERRIVQNIKARLEDEQGHVTGMVTLGLDITDRIETEEKLLDSQTLLQTMFDVMPFIIAIKDTHGNYLNVNRAWQDMYGVSAEEAVTKHPTEILSRPGGETDLINKEDRATLAGPEPVREFETERTDRTGKRRMFQHIKARMQDEDGHVRGLVSLGMDITERRRAEKGLGDSQRLLQTVFDALPVGVFVKDTERRFIMANQAFASLYGMNQPEVIGVKSEDLITQDTESFENAERTDGEVLEAGRQAEIPLEQVKRLDGSEYWGRSIKRPLWDEQGKVSGIVGIREDITEGVHAQAELRANQRLLQTVFDTLPVGIYIKDQDSRIVLANQAFAEVYEKTPEALTGLATKDLHDLDDHATRLSLYTDRRVLISGRQAVIPEQMITTVTGKTYWRRAIKVPLKDEQGKVTGLVCAQEDISEAKQAEQREQGRSKVLEELATGASLRQVLEQMIHNTQSLYPEMLCSVLVLDAENGGLRLGAAPGLPDGLKATMDQLADKLATLAQFAGDEDQRFSMAHLMAHPIWSEIGEAGVKSGLKACWGHPITSPRHEFLGALVVFLRTERELTEEEIEQTQIAVQLAGIAINRYRIEQALRISEERFRNLVDQAVDAFFILEPDGAVVDVNQQACESLGYSRNELLSMRIEKFERNPDFVRDLEAWHQKAEFAPITLNGTHRRRDGSTFPVEVRLGIIRAGGKRLVMAVVRDQSERKWLEEQFTQAQKMRAIGGLAGGIAHEFNNILTPLIGYTNLAQDKLKPDEEAFKDLDIVKKAADRARELVSQILLFSRKKEGERKPTQLESVVREVLILYSSVLPKSITVAQRFEPDIMPVYADPTQMHVLLMNLIANANQAMPDGGVLHLTIKNTTLKDFEVAPRQTVSGQYIHLTVEDSGVGMDEATVSRIFEPFFTTKELGQGTGMGLSSVYGIVQNHDGHIMVESEQSVGTKFDVYLPAVNTEIAQPRASIVRDNSGRESILLVDDEEDIVQLGKYGLERLGYHVLAVTSPADALAAIRENPQDYDLVATDQIMPQMNGDVLLREIRAIRPDIPAIISTGFDTKFLEGEMEKLRVDRLLLKPFGYEELARAIREVLDTERSSPGQSEPQAVEAHAAQGAGRYSIDATGAAELKGQGWGGGGARISVIETDEGIIIEIAGQHALNEEEKQKLLSLYAQAKKNGKHTVVQCENRLYEFLKVTGFDKFLELSVLQ